MALTDSWQSQILCRPSQSSFDVSTGYHNLATKILIKVFEYFDEKELRKGIMPVCKRWRCAALNSKLWIKLEVSGENVPTHFICRRIRDFCNLTSIHLNQIAEPVIIIRQISRCVPKLKHIAIRNCDVVLPEPALRNFIHCCKDLESLDISGTKFKGNKFYEEIAGLVNLKSINLSKNIFLSVHNLMSVVLNCHKLQELRITAFAPIKPSKQLSDEDVLFILSNLAPDLKVLCLDSSNLTNFSFKAIMQCKKLKQLSLYGARNLSPEVFATIKYLNDLNTLKVLDAHLIMGSTIAELFSLGCATMQQVTSIDFTGCWKINNTGVSAIAECCLKLELLRLKSCKSVQSLQPIRDNCTQLKILNIAFCTNLDPLTILPLPIQINTLIIDKGSRFSQIAETVFDKSRLTIKMCLSEYNKEMEDYTPTVTRDLNIFHK